MQINNYPEQHTPKIIKPRKQNTCFSRFALALSNHARKKSYNKSNIKSEEKEEEEDSLIIRQQKVGKAEE